MEEKDPFELAGRLEKEKQEQDPFELAGQAELKKKDYPESSSPTGGKVGGLETPSTGNETAELLGIRPAPKTEAEFKAIIPVPKTSEESAKRITSLYEQKAKKTDDFIKEKAKLNEVESKLASVKEGTEEHNALIDKKNKLVESHNKALADRNILAGEIHAAEVANNEKYGKGNRMGYLYNSFLKGIGSMSSGVADAFMNVAKEIPGAVAPSMSKEEAVETFRKQVEPAIREGVKKQAGVEVVPEKEKKYNDEFWTSAIGGLTSSAPAMVTPFGTGLYAQAYDSGLESINSTEKGKDLPETTKTIFAASVGLAQGVLEKYSLDKIFGKQSSAVASKMATDAIAELAEKGITNVTTEAFEKIIENGAKGLKNKIINAGGKITEGIASEFFTGAAQETSTIAAEKLINLTEKKEIFEPTSWGDLVGRIVYSGAQESVGGGIMGAFAAPFSKTRNYIAEKVAEAKTQEDYQKLHEEFVNNAPSETAAEIANKVIDLYANINAKIPQDTPNRKETIEKVVERDEIKDLIKQKQSELDSVDEAFKPRIQAEIDALNGRIAEINQEIANPATPTVTLNKNTTPTEEKYGTIDRGDGKGVVDLTRAEYEAELAKQGGEVKPMVTEVQFATKQRERRDQEIEEVQQLRNDLGQDVELINDIPGFVDDVVDRMDLGMMVAPEMLSDAIKELDNQFDKLQAYRNDPSRTHTTAQIDAMIDVLGAVKSEIQDYQIKQQENEQQQATTATQTEPATAPTEGVKTGQTEITQEQLLTPNINQNETVNENVREIGNGQKDGQKGDVSQEAKSDVQEGEEKVTEGGVTAPSLTNAATPQASGVGASLRNVELKMRRPENNEVIFVSVDALLQKHAKDQPSYDIQKEENRIKGRVEKAKEFIKNYIKDQRAINPKTGERMNTKVSFEPSVVDIDANGKISFEDGRHRVLAAKELGITEVPIEVPKERVKAVEQLLSKPNEKITQKEDGKPLPEGKNFEIDNKDIFYHASNTKRIGRLKPNTAQQFGTGIYFSTNKDLAKKEFGEEVTEVNLVLDNPVYTNTKEWYNVTAKAIELADADYGKKNNLTLGEDEIFFKYDKNNLSEITEIPSKFISDAAKELGYDAIIDKNSSQYENEIVVLDETKIKYPEEITEQPLKEKSTLKPTQYEKATQKEDGKPLPEGVSSVRTETEERKTSPELRPQEEEVRSIIDNAVANFYAINEATKRSEKREAAKEYRQNLEKMPTVKNIFDNIKTIFAQLEAEGIITKSKDCP